MEFGFWEENYETWKLFTENGIKDETEANEFFGFDTLSVIGGNTWMNPVFEEKIIDETETTLTIINSDGLTAEIPKDSHSTIPNFKSASIVTPDDWKKCKEERFRKDDPARIIDVEAFKKEHPSDREYPLGIGCGSMIGQIRNMLTIEGLAYACYDYPEMVEDMVETCCVLIEHAIDQLLPVIDFDFASSWEDICYNHGPLVSVDFFKDIVMPRLKRVTKKLNKYGVDIWFNDCDGNIKHILPYFLEGGVNCMFPFEVNGSGHPGKLLDEYGKDLRIMGGFDKIQLIKGKSAIKEYMESLVPYVERGGFIPFCDHRCPPDVKEENYLYYLDLKEQMFGGK